MPAMSTMHEQMHQRAGQQDEKRQKLHEVNSVLGPQQVHHEGEKESQRQPEAHGLQATGIG